MGTEVRSTRHLFSRYRQFTTVGPGVRASRLISAVALALALIPSGVPRAAAATGPTEVATRPLSRIDNDLLDDISRRSFRYFWQNTDPNTGLVLDRARFDGRPEDASWRKNVSSIAATGFGLTAYCIAAGHRWISPDRARNRIRTALRFFAYHAQQKHGWFYHFIDATTGKRAWKSEISSIDTALLLSGILTARQAFSDDPEIVRLANLIYDRIDFPWMLNGDQLILSHGWKPETGFLPYRWDTYSEAGILYALAIGSPTHPIPPDAWFGWKLPVVHAGGYAYIGGGPLFIQQYSQAWLDLRNRSYAEVPVGDRVVPRVNVLENAIVATRAQQALGIDLSQRYRGYSSKVWGISASDSVKGYVAWGGSANDSRIDGTVVPSAAAGSAMFTPDICIPALRAMLLQYGRKVYGRYGFADAFNPTTGWVSRYVIGIDVGITLLSAEDLRTGNVWRWFMSNADVERALDMIGLVPNSPVEDPQPTRIFADPQEEISDQDKQKPGPGVEIETEIRIGTRHQIPVSAFKFKIPIPPQEQNRSLSD
ncbi:MAG TPA: glucoamylase family protein [Terriglobia bacterium]|nr:glucoamylase family protein [Terriglobia bacterium]